MSRYMVNKAMWEIDSTDDNLDAFKTDPSGFIDDWESAWSAPDPMRRSGGRLTSDERHALETLDFGYLYGMGANPFLLWQFARSVSVPDLMTIEELVSGFREAVEPHGSPDFAT